MASPIKVEHDLCNRGGYAGAGASFIRSDETWEKTGGRSGTYRRGPLDDELGLGV